MYKELFEKIKLNKFNDVKEILMNMHVQDIADMLENADSLIDVVKVFKVLPKDMGAEVFSYVNSDIQEKLVLAKSC